MTSLLTKMRPVAVSKSGPRVVKVSCFAGEAIKAVPVKFTLAKPVQWGESIAVIGSAGNWALESATTLEWTEGDVWVGTAELPIG